MSTKSRKNIFGIFKILLPLSILTLYPILNIFAQNLDYEFLRDEHHFKSQIKINPQNPDLHYDLASLYIKYNLNSQAIEELKQVVFLNSQDYEAFYRLGILFYEQNKLKLARNHFNKALEINHQYPYAWYYLAIVQTDLCQSKEAIESLEKAIIHIGNNDNIFKTKAVYYLGVLFLNINKKEEALKTAKILTKLDKTLADYLLELASFQ